MSDITRARKTLVSRVLEGVGKASAFERRAAFNNSGLAGQVGALVDKVARHAYGVTDEDISAACASGLSEDQIFEIVVCAAVGQATRQYDAGSKIPGSGGIRWPRSRDSQYTSSSFFLHHQKCG